MKTIFFSGLFFISLTPAWALDTTCTIKGHLNPGIQTPIPEEIRTFEIKYLGSSTLQIHQEVVNGLSELKLMALSQSVSTQVGNHVKRYGDMESFAVSFENWYSNPNEKIAFEN